MKCLNQDQQKALANRELQCQKFEADLKLTEQFYKEQFQNVRAEEWWADPKIVIGGFVISASVAALVTYIVVNERNR